MQPNNTKNCANAIVRMLELHGITHVFGIPGAKIDSLFIALKHSKIKLVLCRHEDGALAPFWVSAHFLTDRAVTLARVDGWDDLCRQIDALRSSPNLFTAVRVDGIFDAVHYRVACKAAPGTDLVTATSHQAEFTRSGIQGTLMGFWSPDYARTFNIPGYHLHFLSADRRSGGHVLAVTGRSLKLQVMDANQLVMALPETPEFLKADLAGDPSAALAKAEGAAARR